MPPQETTTSPSPANSVNKPIHNTDKDEKIDQWTDWTEVKESYDYIKGFSKQISRTPADLDLSKLPAGYGFQVQLRLTDSTENKSKPIIQRMSLSFAD